MTGVSRPGGTPGDGWLSELPSLIERLAQEWSLAVGDPYEPGGDLSWTAPVARSTDGERLVLKIGWLHPECLHEAEALRVWAGEGAVRLHRAWNGPRTIALLLERCEPGAALSQVLAEPDQDLVVAGLLRRLGVNPPAGHGFRPLAGMCARWAAEREEREERFPAPDAGLVREALAMWRELPATAARSALLATDLHSGNILAAQREPWLAIDPKPYVGDPAYNPMQHLLNCPARLAADPLGFCRRMAGLAGVDPVRLAHWTFARLIVECDWPFGAGPGPTNYDVARRLAP